MRLLAWSAVAVFAWGTGTARAQDAESAAPAAAPTVKVVIKSGLGDAFALDKLEWHLDALPPSARSAAEMPGVEKGQDVVLFDGAVEPGAHVLEMDLAYVGTGFGVFTYLKGYTFALKARHEFRAEPGQEVTVRVQTYEKGDLTLEMKDRPAVKVEARARNPVAEAQAAAAVQQQAAAQLASQASASENSLKTADEAYEARIRALEERSEELQQRLNRTRQKLGALQDAVLTGSARSGGARIGVRNDMGNSFRLREVHVYLDGAAIRDTVDPTGEAFAGREELDLFDGRILPGPHALNVLLIYQGVGVGVFSYLNDYQFKLRSTHNFVVEEGRRAVVRIIAYESGDARTEVKDRPTIRFDGAVEPMPAPNAAPTAAAQPPAAAP